MEIIMHIDSASSNQILIVINKVIDNAIIFTNGTTSTTAQ